MTMTKFEPVARLIPVSLPDYDKVWARTFDEYPQELSSSNPFVNGEESPLYTADQLTEAYEAGKRDAIPEGWVLVPKEPTEEMLRAPWLKIDEQTSFKIKTTHNYYKAMLAAAPKGEE